MLEQTPDGAWLCFKDLFLIAADKHAPIVTRRVRGRSVPWLTPEIKDLMHKRDYEHKKAISTNSELHWSNYKRWRNAVNTKMCKEKCNYYSNELSGDQNSKEMWKTLNNILPKENKCANSSSPSTLQRQSSTSSSHRLQGIYATPLKTLSFLEFHFPELTRTLLFMPLIPVLYAVSWQN